MSRVGDWLRERLSPGYAELQEVVDSLGLSWTDLQLGLTDQEWIRLGTRGQLSADLEPVERQQIVERSRVYFQRDPLIHRANKFMTEYVFPQKWSVQAEPRALAIINTTRRSKRNRRLMDTLAGQQKLSDQLLVDGEQFFAYFVGPSSEGDTVRRVNPLTITEIITNPDDAEEVGGYKREWTSKDGTQKVKYYIDWDAPPAGIRHMRGRGARIDNFMSHMAINAIGQRGLPLSVAALDWSQTHRRFMEDRATLTRALATSAFKATTKGGGEKRLQGLKSRLQTFNPENPADQPPVSGGVWWEAGDIELEQFKVDSGASNADRDAYNFRLQVSAGVGIPELFLSGSTADANLASAQALLKPLENRLMSYQQLWMDHQESLWRHVLEWYNPGVSHDDVEITVRAPRLVATKIAHIGDVVNKIGQLDERILQTEVLKVLFEVFGLTNIEEIMARIPDPPVRPQPPAPTPADRNGSGQPTRITTGG